MTFPRPRDHDPCDGSQEIESELGPDTDEVAPGKNVASSGVPMAGRWMASSTGQIHSIDSVRALLFLRVSRVTARTSAWCLDRPVRSVTFWTPQRLKVLRKIQVWTSSQGGGGVQYRPTAAVPEVIAPSQKRPNPAVHVAVASETSCGRRFAPWCSTRTPR